MFKQLLVATVLAFSTQAFSQEYILDNLPAGVATDEVFFTGKWCNAKGRPVYGNRSVTSCSRNGATDSYFFQPMIEAGVYDLYIRWTEDRKLSDLVDITVNYSYVYTDSFTGATYNEYVSTSFGVNQTQASNGWYYVGRYSSLGGENALGIRITGQMDQPANTDGARFVKVQ